MDPVKRRLVYVADENEALLNELSGTPPTRQSRMTRLLVPLSPPLSSQRSSDSLSPPPRPVSTGDATATTTTAVQVDRALLVSYNGFLLADGSGHFATPHTAADAARMRDALKTCLTHLKQFLLADQQEESNSTESVSSHSSSSTFVEEDEESEMDNSSNNSPAPPRRRRAKAVSSSRRPSKMTVAELKEFLRERGVPVAGNKVHLILRAQSVLRAEEQETKAAPLHDDDGAGEGGATSEPRPSSQAAGSDNGMHHSGASVSSLLSTPGSSLLVSPTSRTSTESHSLWGALVTAGSRLFGGTVRNSLGFVDRPTAAVDNEDHVPPPAKRRRSV